MPKLWAMLPYRIQTALAKRFNLRVTIRQTKWGLRCYYRGQVELEEDIEELDKIMRKPPRK